MHVCTVASGRARARARARAVRGARLRKFDIRNFESSKLRMVKSSSARLLRRLRAREMSTIKKPSTRCVSLLRRVELLLARLLVLATSRPGRCSALHGPRCAEP